MWNYEKRLQFPVNIKEPNAKLAQVIISQYGGPDGEMGASMRYLSQRYATPYREVAGLLTDIGTEELAHLEMVAAIVHQLTRNLSMEEIEKSGFAPYYTDHTIGIWPQAAGGIPFNACEFQSKGDVITDLFEDMAAEPYPCKHKQFLLIFKSANGFALLLALKYPLYPASAFCLKRYLIPVLTYRTYVAFAHSPVSVLHNYLQFYS